MEWHQLSFIEKLVPRPRPNATREEKLEYLSKVAALEEATPPSTRAELQQWRETQTQGKPMK